MLPPKIANVNNTDAATAKRRKLDQEQKAAEKAAANQSHSQCASVEDDNDDDDLPVFPLGGIPKNPKSLLEAADGSNNDEIEEITHPKQPV